MNIDESEENQVGDEVVGYFLELGGEDANELFSPYVWSTNGLGDVIKEHMEGRRYGNDIGPILIQYHVYGSLDPISAPNDVEVSNCMSKSKDVGVSFPVKPHQFRDVSERERRLFVVNTTLQAIDLVEKKLGKRKLDIDFVLLRRDVKMATEEYLRIWGVTSDDTEKD